MENDNIVTAIEESVEQPQEQSNQESPEAQEKLEKLESKDTDKMSKTEKKEHEKQLKKFKLKIDGQEYEEEIDLADEESIRNHLQRSKASSKRMQEAAELRKAAEKFIETLKSNPRKILSDPSIGVDVKKLAQEIIDEEIENAQKSPEQIEKEKLQKELEELKDKFKKDEEERNSKEFERLQAEAEQKLDSGITQALETSNLPKTPYTVKKMAEMMMIALQNDIDLSPQDVVPLLRKQMQQDIKDMFSVASDELFEEMFKDNISRVRKRRTKAAVETANSVKATGEQPKEEKKKDGEESKKLTMREFLGI